MIRDNCVIWGFFTIIRIYVCSQAIETRDEMDNDADNSGNLNPWIYEPSYKLSNDLNSSILNVRRAFINSIFTIERR